MAGRAKENLPGDSLQYLFVYLKVRKLLYIYIFILYMCVDVLLKSNNKIKIIIIISNKKNNNNNKDNNRILSFVCGCFSR